MKTVLMNIMDEFRELCKMVPKDANVDKHDPDIPFDQKKWILLRAPWQDPVPHENEIPSAPKEPPRWIVDRYKAVLSQWFYKDTMATPYEQ